MSLAGDKGVLLRPETRTGWPAPRATADSAVDLWQVLFTYGSGDSVHPSPDGVDFIRLRDVITVTMVIRAIKYP